MTVPCMGGCACGTVRHECSAAPLFMFLCHCRDCQRATGNPFAANVWFAVSALTFLSGEPRYYVVSSELGNSVYHGFCPACGSPLGMKSSGFPDLTGVRAASLDDPSGLEPLAELWTNRALVRARGAWPPSMHRGWTRMPAGSPRSSWRTQCDLGPADDLISTPQKGRSSQITVIREVHELDRCAEGGLDRI